MSLMTRFRSRCRTSAVLARSLMPKRHPYTAINHEVVSLRRYAPAARVWIRKCAAALLGGLAWLGVMSTTAANPIAVYLPTTIYWAFDFPFVPSTVSGGSLVYTDAGLSISTVLVNDVDPLAGPTDLPTVPSPLWINPGETIFWSFGGSLTSGDFTYPVCADGDLSKPGGVCNLIPIATIMSDHFGSFSVTGAVFAFNDPPLQIGTWVIHSREFSIPEPATISLLGLGLGLAGLGFSRRRKPN
jgi:PEP-CTERM motif